MPSADTAIDTDRYCLNLTCASARGQVAAVTALLDRHDAYVEEISVFDDATRERFFLRSAFRLPASASASASARIDSLRHAFARLAATFAEPVWQIHDMARPTRVLIMVSKFDHCLRELISAWRRRELPMTIVAVVSNHADLAPLAITEGLPFHHLPVDADSKAAQQLELLRLIDAHEAELVVLARYMQVLSAELCQRLAGRVINIHHSFLPGFKGARPYHQAHERGVKLIGATAHFATTELDEGPIIEQALERVDHADSPQQLLQAGRHVECLVLSRALRYVLDRRVFINGLRTVVLR